MAWSQLDPTGPHVAYLIFTSFLIMYALLSLMIRNRLHLSEPPLATAFGILVGPKGFNFTNHYFSKSFSNSFLQEITRVIVGIQCFAVGLELPKGYFASRWRTLFVLLGPVMTFGWLICALFVMLIFDTSVPTALTISACLTPTDPVLAASVLSNSQFSTRIPKRIRDILSAESGVNDGVSYPFLFFGISLLIRSTAAGVLKKWFLVTVLYQCVLGIVIGMILGYAFNKIYLYSHKNEWMGRASYLAFYLLLAVFSIGIASTLGVDDFLVTICAGATFSHNGIEPTAGTELPVIIDLVLSSAFFVFFGAIIPWDSFNSWDGITPLRLVGFMVIVLLFRRIPVVFLFHRFKMFPKVFTTTEALFIGHFGPIGVGALFLATEARSQLEEYLVSSKQLTADGQRTDVLIWPIVCFVVLASTFVHGLSTLAISVGGHFARHEQERAPLIGAEEDRFDGMIFDEEEGEGNTDDSSSGI